jgi:hypothetical protein
MRIIEDKIIKNKIIYDSGHFIINNEKTIIKLFFKYIIDNNSKVKNENIKNDSLTDNENWRKNEEILLSKKNKDNETIDFKIFKNEFITDLLKKNQKKYSFFNKYYFEAQWWNKNDDLFFELMSKPEIKEKNKENEISFSGALFFLFLIILFLFFAFKFFIFLFIKKEVKKIN